MSHWDMTDQPLHNRPELLAKIADRDPLAFKVLYESYYEIIFKFSFRLLQSESSAEEVIQETMLHIWKLGHKLKTIHNIEAYIKTIARRRAIDLLRINEQALNIERYLLATADLFESTNEDVMRIEAALVILEQGIEKLPNQQREVYQLCYQQGLKYQEVADKLSISHGTVQTHMKLALKFLRGYVLKHRLTTFLIVAVKVTMVLFFLK